MLARLRTTDRAVFVSLTGLDLSDVAAALGEHGVDEPDSSLVQAVHGATGGNPLYVREIGRHLAVTGRPHPRPTVPCSTRSGCPAGSPS